MQREPECVAQLIGDTQQIPEDLVSACLDEARQPLPASSCRDSGAARNVGDAGSLLFSEGRPADPCPGGIRTNRVDGSDDGNPRHRDGSFSEYLVSAPRARNASRIAR
ncbi:Uncharacterised protein [Mycobacteroides abscessus subsp. abscessus]|nr:Uncharacterised protein [Mycobacteroides abscessus subsp. abscessus]